LNKPLDFERIKIVVPPGADEPDAVPACDGPLPEGVAGLAEPAQRLRRGGRAVEAALDLADLGPLADEPPEDIAAQLGEEGEGAATPAGPTVEEPLRGLPRLARVAMLGRETFLSRAREAVSYAWQDIAVTGTIVVLAGGPSEGKTTLLFLLLAARANTGSAVSMLGRLVTPAPEGQRVVLIEGEHGEASTARKLLRSCEIAGVDDSALDRVIAIARKAVRIGSPEWSEVVQLIAAGLVSDIAIDTIARVAPGDANDEREQVAIFDRVAQAIEAAPPGKAPTAWACAHTRKVHGQPDLSDVGGSVQRTGQADSVLLVKGEKINGRTVSSTVTFAKLREDPDPYPEPVTWSIITRDDGSRTIRLAGVAPAEEGAPLEAQIEGLLVSGPKTKNALARATKRNPNDVDAAIGNLFATRRITTTTIKIRGCDRKAFALRSASPVPDAAAE
jgi:hypothetical protein